MWDNHLYIAGTIYRSAHIGAPLPNTGVDGSGNFLLINIRGVAPYWRLAWQQNSKNNNLSWNLRNAYEIDSRGPWGSPAWKTAIPTGPPISRTIGPFRNSGAT